MLEIFLCVSALGLAGMAWQHRRYQRLRRESAQDMQHVIHSAEVFHVIVFFKLKSGARFVDTVRQFKQRFLFNGKARLIYAGQAAFTANTQQLGNRNWDGVLLVEYPSRADYEESRIDPRTSIARQLFADSYLHGMRRNRKASAFMPQLLLRQRLKDLFRGKWRLEPVQATLEYETAPEFQLWRDRVNRLNALHEINRDGCVVYHLVKYGAMGFQGNTELFGSKLLSRMAASSHGPLHIGRCVALEEFARFDRVVVIYYPSARYFAELISSQFSHSIIGGNQLGDSFSVPTVPVTERL